MPEAYTKEIHTSQCCFYFTCRHKIDDRVLIESVHHNFPDAFELETSWESYIIGSRIHIDVEHLPQVMSPAQLDQRLDELYRVGVNARAFAFDHHGADVEFEFAEIRVECCHAWSVTELSPGSG